MHKIANTDELQTELRRLLAYSKSERPSRVRLASALETLSKRVGAKAPAKLKGKKLDKAISDAYYRHGDGVQVNIMDLSKIHNAGKSAYEAAATLEEANEALDTAMKAAIAKYRHN